MIEQCGADAAPLAAGQDVGVTDQIHVAHRLDAHHTDQFAFSLIPPEFDSGGDLAVELSQGHIGFVPAISRDCTAVGLGGSVDDGEDGRVFVGATEADVAHGCKSWLLILRATAARRRKPTYLDCMICTPWDEGASVPSCGAGDLGQNCSSSPGA
jgi:hypothetical protein